jgi:hypothetical protein
MQNMNQRLTSHGPNVSLLSVVEGHLSTVQHLPRDTVPISERPVFIKRFQIGRYNKPTGKYPLCLVTSQPFYD